MSQEEVVFDWRDFYYDLSDRQLRVLLVQWQGIKSTTDEAMRMAANATILADRHVSAIEYEQAKREKHGEKR